MRPEVRDQRSEISKLLPIAIAIGILCLAPSSNVPNPIGNGILTTDLNGNNKTILNLNPTSLLGSLTVAPSSAGQIPIWDGAKYVPGDPLVQGLYANGSTSVENPVAIGGYTTAGTPVLQRAIMLNSTPAGTEYALIVRNIPSGTQTVSVSGTAAVTQSGTWNLRLQDTSGNGITSDARGSGRPLAVEIVDGSGNQITSFGGSGGTASNFGSAFPSSGTAAGWSDGTNMQGPRVFDLDTGGGTQYVAGINLRISGSGGSVEGGTSTNPIRTDPTGTTTQPVSGTVTSNPAPVTSGGLSTFHLASAASTNATNIKASAGQLYGWYIYNSNAAARKVAFHNTAGTPTAGASVFFTMTVPATSGANAFNSMGIPFSTGIGITTVTGLADSDATAVAANDLMINLFYK